MKDNIEEFPIPQLDPLERILRKARKKTEKNILKAFRVNDAENALKYLRAYRTLTKLIDREPLSIFDI